MDRAFWGAVTLVVLLALLLLMRYGWSTRRRRQSGIGAPVPRPADPGRMLVTAPDVLYVATTLADQPLHRVGVHGLGFRARGWSTVTERGVLIGIAGRPDLFIPADSVLGSGRASWTIDRAVERDGLLFIRWRLDQTIVDSYLRVPDPTAATALLDAILSVTPVEKVRPSEP